MNGFEYVSYLMFLAASVGAVSIGIILGCAGYAKKGES